MTALLDRRWARPAAHLRTTGAPDCALWLPHTWDATSVLTVYVVLLLALPSRLTFAPLGGGGTPAAVLGSVLLLWWLTGRVLVGMSEKRWTRPLRWALWLWSAAMLASYVTATTRVIDPSELRSADRGLLFLTSLLGGALVAADGIPDVRRLEVLLRRLVTGGAGLSVVGALQYFTGLDLAAHVHLPGLTPTGVLGGIGQRSDLRRVAATATHPIEFGVVLAMLLPIALHFALHAPPGRKGRWWAAVAAIGATMPMSISRSAFVGFAAASLVLLAGWPPRRRIGFLFCAPLFAVAVRLMAPGLLGTIRSLFLNLWSDSSTTGRTSDYSAVARYFEAAPLFGRGFMTFTPVQYRLLDNEYLKLLVEAGLVGVLTLLAVFVTAGATAAAARRSTSDPDLRDLGTSLAAAVVVPCLAFGTFDALSFPQSSGLTFLLIGCCAALRRVVAQAPRA